MAPDSSPAVSGQAAMQRAEGRAFAEVAVTSGRTRLARLHQAGCLKLRFPQVSASDAAEAILINSSGGLTGGDRLRQDFVVRDGAELSITTQSCERIYRAAQGEARVATTIDVGASASLAFLPQETILFDGAAVARTLDLECAPSSRLLLAESAILGRTLMGETVRQGSLRDRWRVRRGGRLIFAEDLNLSGAVGEIAARSACLGSARAFSTVLCQMPEPEQILSEVRHLVGEAGGASVFEGLILVRLVADTGFILRKRLMPVLSALAQRPLPRIWSI